MPICETRPGNSMIAGIAFMVVTACLAAADLRGDDLDWLLGCWENADRTESEVWARGTDGSLLGFAVTLSGGQLAFHEILRIHRDESGRFSYAAHPMGGAPTVFQEASRSADRVLFSNPDHDYPQEIAYRREGDKLFSTISRLDGADPRSFDKARCD